MTDLPDLNTASNEELRAEVLRLRRTLANRDDQPTQPQPPALGETSTPYATGDSSGPEGTDVLAGEHDHRYRTLVDELREGLVILDLDERFIFTNPAGRRIFGVGEGELIGRNVRDFLDESSWERVKQETAHRLDGHRSSYDITITRSDGDIRVLRVSAMPYTDENQRVVGTMGLISDITEQHRANLEREDSEARLSAVFRTVPIPTFIWCEKDGRVVLEEMNPAAVELVGADRPEMATPVDLFTGDNAIAGMIETGLEQQAQLGAELTVSARNRGQSELEVTVLPLPRRRVMMLAQDISERKHYARVRDALRDMALAVTEHVDYTSILDRALAIIAQLVHAPWVCLYQPDQRSALYKLTHQIGLPETIAARIPFLNPEWELAQGKAVDFHFDSLPVDLPEGTPPLAARVEPVNARDQVSGALVAIYPDADTPPVGIRDDLATVAEQLGQILQRLDAQAQLLASEERFRSIAENIPGAVYVYRFTADGRRVDQYLGPGLEDVIGPERVGDADGERGDIDRIADLAHPEDRDRANDPASVAEQSGEAFDEVFRVRDRTGQYRWIRSLGRPKLEPDGSVLWRGVLLDVHRQTQAEMALQESERRYRLLASNIVDVIFTISTSLKVTYLSPSAERLFDRPIRELLHLPLSEVFTPRSFHRVLVRQARLSSSLDEGRVDELTVRDEFKLKRGNGERFWAEVVASPVVTETSGKVESFVGIIRDITQRKEAEAALAASEERFRSIFETSPLGIATLTLHDMNFLSVNEACSRLVGHQRDELLQMGLDDLLVLEDLRALKSAAFDENGQPMAHSLEMRLVRRDGEEIWVSASSGLLPGEDNEPVARILILEDIDQRKQAEKAIISTNRLEATATLAGGLAHDINNLMAGVMGYAELLEMDIEADSEAREMLQTISSSAREAGDLAQAMIAFSRQGKVQVIRFNLNTAVQEILDSIARSLAPEIRLRVELADNLQAISADPAQMRQTVLSVLRNAVEAVEGGGEIRVRTENARLEDDNRFELPAGDYVQFQVRDTGLGMTREELAHVFEPFYSKKFVGRGMGMAAAYGIVKNHEGEIRYTSRPGAGTVVDIMLPTLPD